MIIQYKNNGVNYIDKAENVKTKTWHFAEVLKRANDRMEKDGCPYDFKDRSEEDKNRVLVWTQLKVDAKKLCSEDVEWQEVEFRDGFILSNMNEENGDLITSVFYTRNNVRHMVSISEKAYLLNDEGKTITKI